MSSKSISLRSAPQVGIGFDRKMSSERWRNSRIHSGSFFMSDIWSIDFVVETPARLEDELLRHAKAVLILIFYARQCFAVTCSCHGILLFESGSVDWRLDYSSFVASEQYAVNSQTH